MQEHQYLYVGHSDTASGNSSCCSGKNYCRQFSGEAKKTKKKKKNEKMVKEQAITAKIQRWWRWGHRWQQKATCNVSDTQMYSSFGYMIQWLQCEYLPHVMSLLCIYTSICVCVCFHSCRLFRKLKRCVKRINNSNNKANSWNNSAAWAAESF